MTTITTAVTDKARETALYHPAYRPDIDGLRAVAVLAVVCFHAFPSSLRGGFIGVDIFFVISGFLISSIVFKSLETDQFSFAEFYKKRALRIFPALCIVLLCCFVAGWFVLFADEFKELGKHILGGALFASNFFLWDESGYFDTTAEVKPLLHLWSLGIEEQFYLVWPLIAWVICKRGFSVLMAIAALWLLSFGLNMAMVHRDPSFTFYMPQTRMWELLSGAFLAYWAQPVDSSAAWLHRCKRQLKAYVEQRPLHERYLRNGVAGTGLLLLVVAFASVTSNSAFPGAWALLPVLGTLLIIMASNGSWLNRAVLGNRVVVWLGLISFPLYLWHWPLLTFAHILEGQLPSRGIRLAMVLLAGVLAWLTYRFVETPIRRKRVKLSAASLYLALLVVGLVGASTFVNGFKQRAIMAGSSEAFAQFVGPVWQFTNNPVCQARYPYKGPNKDSWWFCMTNNDQPPTVLLYGNSYANHLYPGLVKNQQLAEQTYLSVGNCAVGSADRTTALDDEGVSPCMGARAKEQEDFVFDIVKHNVSLKYVIIDGLSLKGDESYRASIDKRVAALLANHFKVIVFVPHLRFDADIKECFSRFAGVEPSPACVVSAKQHDDLLAEFKPTMDYLLARDPDVQFFDQNAALCDAHRCSMTVDGMPIFRDQYQHYSEYASGKVAEQFEQWAMVNAPELVKR
ncbi:acyltransferase family protein [Pseudomonas sp. HR96]|uniref:acyltransferase family protein n=1 Tax=Pseudomonas sp. HR96 TaxID=1027966 RepID=UPI002A754AF7|nr:acyltransferase family protein [Pseudomonas sp. HR96]WPP01675.1 acyltransferase family protein [Pseudomonas sp. HR96]